ncbi:MAG TPA: type VI secretion system-associated protein TagF [Rhodopila sp.]
MNGDAPGFFGKLPARADFLTRGLSMSFTEPWHAWLVRGLQFAAEALAAGFEPAYMAAPVWRFVIPPGACGPLPAAGILMPSVDKVGRRFPLTLAVVSASLTTPLAMVAASSWFDALEETGRDALARDPDIDVWAERLADVVPALPSVMPPDGVHVPLAESGVESAVLPALAAYGAEQAVLFWCEGSPFVQPCALVTPDLPDGAWFTRLLCDPASSEENAP